MPKNVTVFPDAFVYGVGGLVVQVMLSTIHLADTFAIHGGMHGGEIDERTEDGLVQVAQMATRRFQRRFA